MTRRQGTMRGKTVLFLAMLAALPAGAGTLEQELTQQLQSQGYGQVQASRTWLGRLRLQARSGDLMREIVVNPNTGEILRDYAYRVPQSRSGEGGADRAATTATGDDQSDTGDNDTGDEGQVGTAGDGQDRRGVDVPDLIDPKDIAEDKTRSVTGDKGTKRQDATTR